MIDKLKTWLLLPGLIVAALGAAQRADRTHSRDELWALLKAKGVVTQEDLP